MARFQPGQSGNPGGRPKSSLAVALAAEGEKGGKAKKLAALVWKKALAGDKEWAELLFDKMLPKTIGLEGADGAPVRFSLVLGNEQ